MFKHVSLIIIIKCAYKIPKITVCKIFLQVDKYYRFPGQNVIFLKGHLKKTNKEKEKLTKGFVETILAVVL